MFINPRNEFIQKEKLFYILNLFNTFHSDLIDIVHIFNFQSTNGLSRPRVKLMVSNISHHHVFHSLSLRGFCEIETIVLTKRLVLLRR